MAKTADDPILRMIRSLAEDHPLKNVPDQELLRRFTTEQDQTAFVGLVRRHGAMVLGLCRNVAGQDAEDAFQATFLILAQKAKSIRNLASIGSWLYGVAYRTALKARAELAKRQKHEQQAGETLGRGELRRGEPPTLVGGSADLPWHVVQQIIHAELNGLVERYRAPLVLCYLQGRSQEEAARHLRISKATLKRCLERGRELLRSRLVRRGLGPAALAAVAAWPAAKAAACVPPVLAASTVQSAMALAAGHAAAGVLSSQVTYLLENGLKTMMLTKLKMGIAAVAMVGLLPALGGYAFHAQSETALQAGKVGNGFYAQRPASAFNNGRSATAQPAPQETEQLSGRVLDVAGKPAAGAKLQLLSLQPNSPSATTVEIGTTAANGQFKVTVPKKAKDRRHYLIARVEGFGIDFVPIKDNLAANPIELRVVADNPIEGRLINTEGKPVAGAKVSVVHVHVPAGNSLDAFLIEWKKNDPRFRVPYGVNDLFAPPDSIPGATTDADGRFKITGAGGERVVELLIRGDGIAESTLVVANRKGFDPKPYNQAADETNATMFVIGPKAMLQGPTVAPIAEAERIIRGVVKDIDSGKPRIDATVYLKSEDMTSIPHFGKTNAEGRYEIRGVRRAPAYRVEVENDTQAGYVGSAVTVLDQPGYEPLNADISVKKGVIVTGRVVDAAKKQPVPGIAYAGILNENPFVKKYPDLGTLPAPISAETQETEDGLYRLVALPGPTVLMGAPYVSNQPPETRLKYKPAVPDPKYPQYFNSEAGVTSYFSAGGFFIPLQGNYCKVLVLEPDAGIVRHDIVLEPATALPVAILDSDGQPLVGAWVTGIGPHNWEAPLQIKTDTCSAYHIEPGQPRLMVFYHAEKKLIGSLALKGDEKKPVVVHLGQPATLKGRLLGEDGKPLANAVVNLHFRARQAQEIHDRIHRANFVETDAEGRFQFDKVIPGRWFSLSMTQGTRRLEPVMKMDDRLIQSGEVLDMGQVKLKPRAE